LNINAGGNYIWIYSTKDTSAGTPLRNLFVQIGSDQSGIKDSGWSEVQFTSNDQPPDLNKGAGGSYVYLWMQR